jgi:hypothetical protein
MQAKMNEISHATILRRLLAMLYRG